MPTRNFPITARGFATLITGAISLTAGILLGASGFTVFGIVLLTLVPVALISLYLIPAAVRVGRAFSPAQLPVGDTTEVTLTLTKASWFLTGGLWREMLPAGLASGTGNTSADDTGISGSVTLRGRASKVIRYDLTGVSRGVHTVGPVKMTVTDAFGMTRRTRTLRNTVGQTEVTVTPRILPLVLTPGGAGVSGDSRSSTEPRAEQQVADLVPRPFAPGDSRRRVHWRASARLGELMVRQEEPHTHQTAIIMLNLAPGRWPIAGTETEAAHLDAAVTLTASLTNHYARQGFGVRVVDDAGSLLGTVSSEGRGMDSLLLALATAQPADRAEAMTVADLLQHTRNDVVTIVTGMWTPSDSADLPARQAGSASLFATHPDSAAKEAAEALGWMTGRVARILGEHIHGEHILGEQGRHG